MPRTRTVPIAILSLAAPVVWLGCSSSSLVVGPPQPTPSSAAGCYAVGLGGWNGPRESPDPPSVIALLDSLGTNGFEVGKQLARPDPRNAAMPFTASWWARPDPDHLSVYFSLDGIIGVRMFVAWDSGGGRWSGTAEAFTDVSPSTQAVSAVSLSPRPCT